MGQIREVWAGCSGLTRWSGTSLYCGPQPVASCCRWCYVAVMGLASLPQQPSEEKGNSSWASLCAGGPAWPGAQWPGFGHQLSSSPHSLEAVGHLHCQLLDPQRGEWGHWKLASETLSAAICAILMPVLTFNVAVSTPSPREHLPSSRNCCHCLTHLNAITCLTGWSWLLVLYRGRS